MRKLKLKMEVSVDGFVGGTDGDVEWAMASYDDEELTAATVDALGRAGVHAMGRRTYEDMAAHWPTSEEPFAPPMNDIPKVVFSRTLPEATWPETRIARGDLAEEVARLKAQPGDDILAHGGAGFAQALTRLDLVDEYHLNVHPVALGEGLPLFGGRVHLRARSARTYRNGAVTVVYERA
ncbi:MAG TPA: dihydrofolate reductase family protein [Solirubrobacteraceae bacterium]|nr:dihydrofolate reductase family protein [Solirubrobacteraceae bacterium]